MVSQWKGIVSICTAYLPHSYVEQWGGCADECHERSPYAVCHENYASIPLTSYVCMNFTSDYAEIPAWMMCTEGHEKDLPAEVRKSPRWRRYTRCEVLPLQTKEHLCLNTGFTLEPWQRYVVPAGTVNENVSEVLVSMPLLMLALQ